MSTVGHNSRGAALDNESIKKLRSYVHRIETLEAQRKELADDVKEIKVEAKSHGYDVKTINAVLRHRKKDPAKAAEEQDLLDTYLGVFA